MSALLSGARCCLFSPSLSSAPAGEAVAVESGARGQIIFLIEVTMWLCWSAGRDCLEFNASAGTERHPQVQCFQETCIRGNRKCVLVSPHIKYYT